MNLPAGRALFRLFSRAFAAGCAGTAAAAAAAAAAGAFVVFFIPKAPGQNGKKRAKYHYCHNKGGKIHRKTAPFFVLTGRRRLQPFFSPQGVFPAWGYGAQPNRPKAKPPKFPVLAI